MYLKTKSSSLLFLGLLSFWIVSIFLYPLVEAKGGGTAHSPAPENLEMGSGHVCMRVSVFPTGQGNTVLLRYGTKAILVDAGSSESKFTALCNARTEKRPEQFDLKEPQPPSSTLVSQTLALQGRQPSEQDSWVTGSVSPDQSPPTHPQAKRGERPRRADHEKIRTSYMDSLLGDIRSEFPVQTVQQACFVQTVLVTHADEDHYNLIPSLFDDQGVFRIGTLILSGFYEDYNDEFRSWVERYWRKPTGKRKSSIENLICTGMADGSTRKKTEGQEAKKPEDGYARAYSAAYAEQTSLEQKVEQALRFTVQGDDQTPPILRILSMNAGHATEPDGFIRMATGDTNANSLMLRLEYKGQSTTFTGDADDTTWNHVFAAYRNKREALQTDYLLVSHHGSKERGATRMDVLEALKPKACVVSVGRSWQYHHPHKSTVQLLLGQSDSLWHTKAHRVNYFTADTETALGGRAAKVYHYKRALLTQGVFATVNNGTLSWILGNNAMSITASTNVEKLYTLSGIQGASVTYFSPDQSNIYKCQPGKTAQEAEADLREHFKAQQIGVKFWCVEKKTTKRRIAGSSDTSAPENQLTPYFTQVDDPTVHDQYQHILVTHEEGDDKHLFAFLEEVDAPPSPATAPVSSTAKPVEGTAKRVKAPAPAAKASSSSQGTQRKAQKARKR